MAFLTFFNFLLGRRRKTIDELKPTVLEVKRPRFVRALESGGKTILRAPNPVPKSEMVVLTYSDESCSGVVKSCEKKIVRNRSFYEIIVVGVEA